ncbi:MAG TPA: CvpA family protein [Acidimicrobiales bacterium]
MTAPEPGPRPTPEDPGVESSLPSTGARVLAFAAILLGGLCGGMIGYSVTDLECTGNCSANTALGGVVGAVMGALGVAVIAVLALRAMGEWKTIQAREEQRQRERNDNRRNPSA